MVARDGRVQPFMIIARDADVMRDERSKAGGRPEPEIAHTLDTQLEVRRVEKQDR